jgi:hypothetical protein
MPEVNVLLFAFLLNVPWELLQISLYRDMVAAPHWRGTEICMIASLGDAIIAVVAYSIVSGVARSRYWVFAASPRLIAAFAACDTALSVLVEEVSTKYLERWTYAPAMPIVPLLGIGLTPLLQPILLSLITIWFVRRQLEPERNRLCETSDKTATTPKHECTSAAEDLSNSDWQSPP